MQPTRIFQCCKIQHKQNSLKTSSSWRFCKCTVQTATNINKNPFTVFQLLHTVGLESLHNPVRCWKRNSLFRILRNFCQIYRKSKIPDMRTFRFSTLLGHHWKIFVKSILMNYCKKLFSRKIFQVVYQSRRVEKQEIHSHLKNISSNQLFSNLFSKTITFTKFLPREFP